MADQMEVDSPEPRGIKRTASQAGLPPEAPRRIKALDQDVVNKIAAGEIIVAPMHALKELLENAVDAGATSIEIVVKEGGLKMLQITDNGHGIEKDDLPILCERFTTSKLNAFEDLSSIATYGFRGEALASISHIAHLRVTTKTASSSAAWQAHYAGGKMVPPKPGMSAEPKAAAGRPGTQLLVEDLFYNVPNRRKAFRSPSEEYTRILDIVGRYAVHCSHVAFSVKKHGESGPGMSVPISASIVDRIKQIHGSSLGNELISFEKSDGRYGFKASGWSSNANYHAKRTTILLFINHRSVESSLVKKAIEETYAMFLPKGGRPIVYLSLEIDPARVDVNVHPTKKEVHFLSEDETIELVCNEIRDRLAQVDTSRTFKAQGLLPGVSTTMTPARSPSAEHAHSAGPGSGSRPGTTKKPYENNLVRTDSKARKITSMLPPALSTRTTEDCTQAASHGFQYETIEKEQVSIRLTSIKNLRAEVRDAMHNELTEMFATHTYVGLVDERRRLVALQSGVKLYLIDYGMVANDFFYQVGLTDFGNFGRIMLNPPADLQELIRVGAQVERDANPEVNLDVEQIVARVHKQLMSRKAMLKEYFALDISDESKLESLPLMLKGYMPNLAKLPRFLVRLGPYVDWTDEQKCFETFLTELAAFYTPEKIPIKVEKEDGGPSDEAPALTQRREEMLYMLEHVLFPAFKSRIVATKGLLKGCVEIANLKGLYRVFERC